MTEVFGLPEGFREPPDLNDFRKEGIGYDVNALFEAEATWVEELAEWCRTNSDSRSELIGEVIRFPRGDGYAQYMVWRTKPLGLLHIPLGDAWDLPDYQLRGLRVKDVRELVHGERAMRELFNKGS
jgi:hypothetical protein